MRHQRGNRFTYSSPLVESRCVFLLSMRVQTGLVQRKKLSQSGEET
jgi:hypothetical protein